jgi:hypothetical protein
MLERDPRWLHERERDEDRDASEIENAVAAKAARVVDEAAPAASLVLIAAG